MAGPRIASPPFQVVQAVSGAFHHFDLARELEARGCLKAIYSTFPWRRLAREGVSRSLVHTFPWIHTPQMLVARWGRLPARLDRLVSWQVPLTFDAWVTRQLTPCDFYVAISGSGVRSGRRAQELGAKFICDRGSSHI